MPGMSGLELLSKLLPVADRDSHDRHDGTCGCPHRRGRDESRSLGLHREALPAPGPARLHRGCAASRLPDAPLVQDRRGLQSRLELLTSREREVLDHLITGQTNKNTAYELGISQKTVDFHREYPGQSRRRLPGRARLPVPRRGGVLAARPWDICDDDSSSVLLSSRQDRP